MKDVKTRFLYALYGLGIAIVLIGSSVYTLWGLYYQHWEGDFARRMTRIFPIPVAKIGNDSLLYRVYFEDLDSLQTYLTSAELQGSGVSAEMTDDQREQVLERMMQEYLILRLGDEKQVQISEDEIATAIETEFLGEGESMEDFEVYLRDNYAWSLDDFKRHLVRPILIERKLMEEDETFSLQVYLDERLAEDDIVRLIRF